jgi:hypothetical protein
VIREGRGGIVSDAAGAHAVPATRADIFVSTYAGGAGDDCVLTHHDNPLELLSTECFPPAEPVAAAHLNSRDFIFDVPLPPKPADGRVAWRVEDHPTPGGVAAGLDVQPHVDDAVPRLEVHVTLTQKNGGMLPSGYAATLYAGWENDSAPLIHVRVSIDAVVIHNALQPATPSVPKGCSTSGAACTTSADCPSGELCFGAGAVKSWRLQAAVNGEWRELSGLGSVSSGDVIPQSVVFDQYLPADGEVHLLANGDAEDCIHTMLGKALATDLAELGFDKGLECLMTTPHNSGEVDARYTGPDFGAGPAFYETVSGGGDGGNCSATADHLCLIDADCPAGETCQMTGGAFALRYHIERVAD